MRVTLKLLFVVLLSGSAVAQTANAPSAGLQAADLLRFRFVTDVAFSPDGARLAYVVENNDGAGRPYPTLWILTIADGKSVRVGAGDDRGSEPTWSPDGHALAFDGRVGGKEGIFVAGADGSAARFLVETDGTNSPNPISGKSIAWSPDGKRIAFVSAVPGPETKDASGDPVIITRYLYKPDFYEGNSHFNDNKRTHVFVIESAGGAARQLTTGNYYEHSIEWAPAGEEIAFVSNREPDPDRVFNNDLFTVNAASGAVRRLTATEGCEFQPRWSPDGKMIAYRATKRGLTDLETNMEDTHVWVMNADGSGRRELGAAINNRQGGPAWTSDGTALLFTVQERGSNHLYRMPVAGGKPELLLGDAGFVGSFSTRKDNALAYAFAGRSDAPELFLKSGAAEPRKLTNLNGEALAGKQVAPVESFTFISNDNKWNVEAFLTRPVNWSAEKKYPLIVVIHGGPHGQQGPAFNFKNQVYAAHGLATLMVNYRGSTGYGQEFADAVFRDQDGDEAMDVVYAVGAALRRNPWIDPERLGIEGGSYGGQLTCWLITQTNMFKAAIPAAAITNFISYNYMTYYNQYEEMEWGARPHQGNLMDVLWERSPLKHIANVKTPTLLVHGENDPDVPIAESEQFYIALKDVGVETVFARYPREGHGLREPKHIVDWIARSLAWYDGHFTAAK